MKAFSILTLFVAFGAGTAIAQQSSIATSPGGPQRGALQTDIPAATIRLDEIQLTSTDTVKVKKRFVMTGPVAKVFSVKKVAEVPKRFFHLINPFAKSETGEGTARYDKLETRAWTTTVGWHPGASAFPDETTQEPVGLLSFGWR